MQPAAFLSIRRMNELYSELFSVLTDRRGEVSAGRRIAEICLYARPLDSLTGVPP